MTPEEFPVINHKEQWPGCPASVPWGLLAPHEKQALRNHNQTLTRLAERGGCSPCELVALIEERRHQRMTKEASARRLIELIDRHLRLTEPTAQEIDDHRWAMQTFDSVHGLEPREYSDAEVIAELLKPMGRCSNETALEEQRRLRRNDAGSEHRYTSTNTPAT